MPSIAPDKAALMPSDQQGLPLSGKSVLIIEDEALIALSVESCLLAAGAAVVKMALVQISGAVLPLTRSLFNANWPFLIRCTSSMPAIVIDAFRKRLNPSIGPNRSLIDRWSCSIKLLRYFDDRILVR